MGICRRATQLSFSNLLAKIQKWLFDVPGRPVIFDYDFYTEYICSFLDFHSQPLAQKTKYYIKGTNYFSGKIKELGQLPKTIILCTNDVVSLYPNISHDEALAFLKDFLENRVDKQIPTDTLLEFAEFAVRNNILNFLMKQVHGTAIGT